MDEKEAEARPVMGTIFLVVYTDHAYENEWYVCKDVRCLRTV